MLQAELLCLQPGCLLCSAAGRPSVWAGCWWCGGAGCRPAAGAALALCQTSGSVSSETGCVLIACTRLKSLAWVLYWAPAVLACAGLGAG